MADREPSTRGSAALKIRRSSVQIRDLLASSTAAMYSSGAALQRSVGTPNAALTCSTPIGDTPARGSGRRVDGTLAFDLYRCLAGALLGTAGLTSIRSRARLRR